MLKGQVINGYKILEDFTTAGGGLSKWTFAQKGEKIYFIKEFLAPKYPTENAPGSPASKERKRKECEKFENHHKSLMKQINEKCGLGGNLIYTLDFFREGSTYYKVTEKIDVASLSTEEVYALPLANKILILKTIAHSLNILHKAGVVHGDLKPDNVLIKQTRTNFYTTKLIDFDNSYFSGKAPQLSEEVVGDMVFYSPELARCVQGSEETAQLNTKSDIFALGLLYCIYLQGELPEMPKKYAYACLAVNEGKELKLVDTRLPQKLKKMVNLMLSYEAEKRPSCEEIFEVLKNLDIKKEEEATKLEKESRKSYVDLFVEAKEKKESSKTSLKLSFDKKVELEKKDTSKLKGKGLDILKK
ncbi:MAG: protein kinase [Thermonemataceae bacterium]|nr:protein kinase [Thermonemataceae bacterium]